MHAEQTLARDDLCVLNWCSPTLLPFTKALFESTPRRENGGRVYCTRPMRSLADSVNHRVRSDPGVIL